MDTQPLLRIETPKPQPARPAPVQRDNSADFDRHLQGQIERNESREAVAKSDARAVTQADAAEPKVVTEQEQATTDDEETDATVVASDVALNSSDEATDEESLDGLIVVTTQQGLPQDGNALPLILADLLNKNVAIANAEKTTQVVAQPDAAALLTAKQSDPSINDAIQLHEMLGENISLESGQLPELKLQLKSADVLSDKQMAALMTDMSKPTATAMQQVVAVTGSASANIQNYLPPQFDAMQVSASGVGVNSSINTPVNHPAWGSQVGDQLAVMLQGKIHSAEIKLNPAHLGPLEIHLSLKDDQASVTFVSAHAPVREALDAAMPKLRDMLEQQGLNLLNVDVSAHSGSQREAFAQQTNASATGFEESQDQTGVASPVITAQIETGLSLFV